MPIALTVDIHAEDRPADIGCAARWLREAGIPATFFVPSALFEHDAFRPHLVRLPTLGHEVGSHGHRHDFTEIRALMRGETADLAFLRRSHALYQEIFGSAPIAFRSPAWCPLGPAAIAMLVALGYRVDSSATPQRLPIFSSTPYANTWYPSAARGPRVGPRLVGGPHLLPAAARCLAHLVDPAPPGRIGVPAPAALGGAAPRRVRAVRATSCERLRTRRRAAITGGDAGSGQLSAAAGWRAALQGVSARTQSGARICDHAAIIETLRGEPLGGFVRLRDLSGSRPELPPQRLCETEGDFKPNH